jgi:hypothetical protein
MKRVFATAGLFAGLIAATQGLAASVEQPAVVELFTSQGCSSCPPANTNLRALADRPDVLALSFDVTYWDYLGWKDTFDRPEYTQRQADYERPLHEDGPFTPQIVVDGRSDTVGNERGAIERLIAESHRDHAPALQLGPDKISIGASMNQSGQVWLVRYDPRVQNVAPQAGENSGVALLQKNVVRSLILLGDWNGTAKDLALPKADAGLKTAVLLQQGRGGAILAAARN